MGITIWCDKCEAEIPSAKYIEATINLSRAGSYGGLAWRQVLCSECDDKFEELLNEWFGKNRTDH